MGRGLVVGHALVMLLLLAWAAPASAGVAESQYIVEPLDICGAEQRLTYTEVRSERNTVVVADAQTPDLNPHLFGPGPSPCFTLGGIAIADLEAPVVARDGCFGLTARAAICSYSVVTVSGPHQMVVDVGAMNDSVRVRDVPHAVTVQLGSGSDNGRVANGKADTIACGAGTDQVIADAVDVVAADCEQVIRI